MNAPNDLERARLMELAVERSVGGLSESELLELERSVGAALGGAPRGSLDESFERAAAAAHLALRPPLEPMPRELAVRIANDADRYYAAQRVADVRASRAARQVHDPLPTWFAWSGWMAAAASFAAVIGVLALDRSARQAPDSGTQVVAAEARSGDETIETVGAAVRGSRAAATLAPSSSSPTDSSDRTEVPDGAGPSDPAAARAALLAATPFVLRRNWAPAGDPAGRGVSGDVVWDARTQTGYMRFVGLRRNDASREQYQLWIFDGRRDERFPVDGGVFDSVGDAELVVPIRARLPIGTPLAFAVTVERAGGVVVSNRERVVVIARVS